MCKTIGQDVSKAIQVMLQGGAVSPLLLRFGFQSTDGRLKSLHVLPQGCILLLVLGGRFPKLPQLRFSY